MYLMKLPCSTNSEHGQHSLPDQLAIVVFLSEEHLKQVKEFNTVLLCPYLYVCWQDILFIILHVPVNIRM